MKVTEEISVKVQPGSELFKLRECTHNSWYAALHSPNRSLNGAPFSFLNVYFIIIRSFSSPKKVGVGPLHCYQVSLRSG